MSLTTQAPPGLEGPVRIIYEACVEFYRFAHPMQKLDVEALRNHIESHSPSFTQILDQTLWARTAFHLLGMFADKSASHSSAIRYLNIHEQIGDALDWDTDTTVEYM